MIIGIVRGVITLLLLLAFIGCCVAWRGRQRPGTSRMFSIRWRNYRWMKTHETGHSLFRCHRGAGQHHRRLVAHVVTNKDSGKIPRRTPLTSGRRPDRVQQSPAALWLWMFFLSSCSPRYLVLFRASATTGLLHWSSVSQLDAEDSAARAAFEQRFAGYKDKSLTEMSKDPTAMATARNLFALNCSSCHGSDARGAKAFPT